MACVVLHNIAVSRNLAQLDVEVVPQEGNEMADVDLEQAAGSNHVRD